MGSSSGEMSTLECDVCFELYNENIRIPRCLSCKHVLCTSCIIQLIRKGPLKCPFCRGLHNRQVISSVDIPVHLPSMASLAENSEKKDVEKENESEVEKEVWLNVTKLRLNILKANAEGSSVYALQVTAEGQSRCARVTLHDDRLHLHALKDGSPPEGSHVVPYDQIRALADEVHVITFLEVTLKGIVQGHIYIKHLDDAGRSRQFLFFCTGEKGPSYSDTKFFEVIRKNMPGEQIWGGDYENNDGSGGAALPEMTRGPQNYQVIFPGLVAGFYYPGYGCDHNPSNFGIYTRYMPGYNDMSSIGIIVKGLDMITSIAQGENVHDASVSECGLVLFH